MTNLLRKTLGQALRTGGGRLISLAPGPARFVLSQSMFDCDAPPDPRLELKIADSLPELEACFRILHDAYVGAGFMRPDPSGLRVTPYHALPTTTTLCAKIDGEVVGTVSIVREGVFGLPMQSAFDVGPVRERGGQIAEISALAIHRSRRGAPARVLLPLMKFVYEYCTGHFDTRHLVIAVNPRHIGVYESLLRFRRLDGATVDHYAFVNGAPAVGATLDLAEAPSLLEQAWGRSDGRRNLHRYFIHEHLEAIRLAPRRYFTTNHPVMTAQMLDHFFNRRTRLFATLTPAQSRTLHAIYDHPAYAAVLPGLADGTRERRRRPRYTVRCPAAMRVSEPSLPNLLKLDITEVSGDEFRARSPVPLPTGLSGELTVELGERVQSVVSARVLARRPGDPEGYRFELNEPDAAWRECVAALGRSHTYADLVGH